MTIVLHRWLQQQAIHWQRKTPLVEQKGRPTEEFKHLWLPSLFPHFPWSVVLSAPLQWCCKYILNVGKSEALFHKSPQISVSYIALAFRHLAELLTLYIFACNPFRKLVIYWNILDELRYPSVQLQCPTWESILQPLSYKPRILPIVQRCCQKCADAQRCQALAGPWTLRLWEWRRYIVCRRVGCVIFKIHKRDEQSNPRKIVDLREKPQTKLFYLT